MRKRKRIIKLKNKKLRVRKITNLFYLSIFLFVFIFIYIFFKVGSLDKFIFINNVNENAEIVVIDSKSLKITRVFIPGDTQIIASRELGTYKINSLWKLGEKEGFQGKLVADSVKRNFLLPIYFWKDGSKSNLNIFQKIKIFLIERKISNYDVSEISLVDSRVLKQKKLTDGSNGYVISSKIPESISIHFIENLMTESVFEIQMEDLTGDIKVTEDVSKILGVMGAKITSYSKGFDENLDCEVIGDDREIVKIIINTFDCKEVTNENLESNLKIRLGKRFAERF